MLQFVGHSVHMWKKCSGRIRPGIGLELKKIWGLAQITDYILFYFYLVSGKKIVALNNAFEF